MKEHGAVAREARGGAQEVIAESRKPAIRQLPELLINQIAAGEVVERPLSVVRELVENALDAEAKMVEVSIEAGGRALIAVSDDGKGIRADDIPLTVARHATSKIASLEDLQDVRSLGFRGEALSSIASVSRFRLSSRHESESVGKVLEVGYATGIQLRTAPRAVGTTVEVAQLFFNTPARRKFLKSERYEKLTIRRWIEWTALVWPKCSFRLVADGKEELFLSAVGDFRERARALYGSDIVLVDMEQGEVCVRGALSKPSAAIKDKSQCVVLVNGRKVSDAMLQRAVRDGFGGLLRQGLSPRGFVHVALPAELVDVNVHPQKSEVRFSEPSKVFVVVRRAVSAALSDALAPVEAPVRSTTGSATQIHQPHSAAVRRHTELGTTSYGKLSDAQQTSLRLTASTEATSHTLPHGASLVQEDSLEMTPRAEGVFSQLLYRGQLFGCYLLCESKESFVVIDMHAAHERLNFNRLREAYEQSRSTGEAPPSATLLFPVAVEVGEEAALFFEEQSELFTSMGFEVEPFGSGIIAVRAIPSFFPENQLKSLFQELALAEYRSEARKQYAVFLERLWSRIACHKSLRAGDELSATEAYSLLEQLDRATEGTVCPHGRPVSTTIARQVVEQWFARHHYG